MEMDQRGNNAIFMKGRLKLSAYMNYGHLTVHIMKGSNPTWKANPNTFVMIALIPVDSNTTPTRCRTEIIRATNYPVYEEKFSFEISDDDMNKRLLISVVARDSNNHNQHSLGCMSFGLRHIAQEGREINGWYYLLSDDIGLRKHRHVIVKERRPSAPRKPDVTPVPAINQEVSGMETKDIAVSRSRYGGFGFSLVESCPVKVGRIDASSPAEEAGLEKGDIVVRVNGFNVSRSTSVSVARLVKKSGQMVYLEVCRPVSMETDTALSCRFKGHDSDSDSGAHSIQEFTICDERAALLESAISVDTRRQAALHRLLCMEENYVDLMNVGTQRFSRPLRHCLLTSDEHSRLFQNIEKIVCMSEFQVRQILANLPSNIGSDDEDDMATNGPNNDLTWIVGMIYLTKLPVLCQAYSMYAKGLSGASQMLAELEKDWEFNNFVMNIPSKGRELSICDFINRPLSHIQDLCGMMETILETTVPDSRDYVTYKQVVIDLQSCVAQIRSTSLVTSHFLSTSASVFTATMTTTETSTMRRVPLMGSLVLKRAQSHQSSTSGFGSASSQSSGEQCVKRETVV